MAAVTTTVMIPVRAKEGEEFEVPRDVIKLSGTVNTLLKDLGLDDDEAPVQVIPLANVTAATLRKVIEWCTQHKDDPVPAEDQENNERRTDDIPAWDVEFFKLEQSTLFEIILAANYMDVKVLLDYACKTVANMIKGKTTEEIRRTFNIVNDFTPEEEEQIRKENAWCED